MDTSNTMLEHSKRMDGLFKKILQNGYGNNKDYYKRMLNMMTKHNNPLWDKDMDVIYIKIAL